MLKHERHKPSTRGWLFFAIVVVLVAGHGVLFSYFAGATHFSFASTKTLAALGAAAVALIVVKHVGLIGSVVGISRGRTKHKAARGDEPDQPPVAASDTIDAVRGRSEDRPEAAKAGH